MRGVVLTEKRGAVLIITINRPAARNAMNAESARALSKALDALDSDPGLQLGILTGAGAFFSAGADLKVAAETGSSGALTERGAMGMCALPPGKLLIAAIEGGAVGGGLEMALACDLIVAAHGAKLGLPEVRRGLVAMGGGLLRLPSRIAPNIATEVAITGELYPASFFHRHGLVNRLAAPGRALDVAFDLAALILRNGPGALAATLAILRARAGALTESEWPRQRELARHARNSAEGSEEIGPSGEESQASVRARRRQPAPDSVRTAGQKAQP